MALATRRGARSSVRLNLALQGGGAQGAFTWGVLDRLLDEEHIAIDRISGTSAGALNGAALATGWARGGREGAQEHLAMLWHRIAEAGSLLTFLLLPLRKPGLGIWDDALPIFSPYQVNPLGMAPLRAALAGVVDEALLRKAGNDAPQLFANAVHVHTGRSRVFSAADLSIDALLASACAPLFFQAVEIEGESYWDGSYAANPPLWPLYERQLDCDIFIVELTPLHRAETPTSAKNILNRINEVASINGLVSELRALDTISRNLADASIRVHVLSTSGPPATLLEDEPSIKRTVSRVLFERLREDGRRACDAWLQANGALLGKSASTDIGARYLAPYAAAPGSDLGVHPTAQATAQDGGRRTPAENVRQ
jgi:NTE family protein